jgi:lipopolysaccharide exporter
MKSLKNSYWIKSGFYSIGSRIFVLLFGFGSFYILVRHFSKQEFGTWALFLTIVTIIETSRNGLIQNALIKLVHSNDHEDSDKIISATWILNTVYTLFIFLVLVLVSGMVSDLFEAPEISKMFLYYGITITLLIPFSQFNYIQQSRFSFSGIFWGAFVRYGTFFISNLIIHLLAIEITLPSLVLVQSFCTFLGLIISYFLAREFLMVRFEWSKEAFNKVFHFGKYVMGTNIFSMIYKSTDQFTIGYFLNTSAVATYNAAVRLSNIIEYPTTSIAEIVYPKSTAQYAKGGEQSSKLLFEQSVGITIGITLPMIAIVVLFAEQIIHIVAGPAYADSVIILRFTILFGLFTPFSRQFGTALDSSGRPKLNFYILLASLIINIIANVIGVSYFGLMGACYGTLASYIIIFIVNNYFMKKIFKIQLREVFKYLVQFYVTVFHVALRALKLK